MAIEVKVGAGEQDNQLVRYAKTLNETYSHKTKHIYFLTVDGHNSETCECDKDCEIKCKTDATTISFNKHICDWLRDIGHCEFPNPIAIQFLEVLELSQKNTADKLVEWFYDRERFPMAIQCIAESADRFFCDNN